VPQGRAVRPTSDRAKETLFDILGDRIRGCRFLDLYSGTGSVGLEAASRGAAAVLLVESQREAWRVILENVEQCGLQDKCLLWRIEAADCLEQLVSEEKTFDFIFLDPPYRQASAYGLIEAIGEKGLLNPEGWVIAEHDRHCPLPEGYGSLIRVRTRRVGESVFSFYGVDHEGEDRGISRVL
jgi:16S rRNA (guanine(966)-N(2))-methyltransferase RsmD